jgi:prepilin-type processing-associated H-X9-DG protein
MVGLLLSAVQKVRSASARIACHNQIKQIILATHLHHDAHHSLPPGHRSPINRDLMPYTGWTISLLPYLEQDPLYATIRPAFRKSWAPFVNPPHVGIDTVVPAFLCPSDDRIRVAQYSLQSNTHATSTSYLGVAGQSAYDRRDGMLYLDSRHSWTSCTDGLSQTLLFGERPPSHDFQFGWWYAGYGQDGTGSLDLVMGVREPNRSVIVSGSPCGPGRYPYRPASGFGDPCGAYHFWSSHSGGANFGLADGSVRFIPYSANEIMPSLATRAGGEVFTMPE